MEYEIDFLPVGEGARSGDAIIVRFGDLHGPRHMQKVIVIDGGYQINGDAIIAHLEKYYRTDRVDLVVSTHPDCDHANGLEVVLERLKVGVLLMHLPWRNTLGISDLFTSSRVTDATVREHLQKSLDYAKRLEAATRSRGINIVEPFAGITAFNGAFQILGPTQGYYQQLLADFRGTPEARKETFLSRAADMIARLVEETLHLETLSDDDDTSAENNSSVVSMLTVNGASMLFTADAGKEALTNAAAVLDAQRFDYRQLRFVQIPHHGSRRNVGPTILNKLLGPRTGSDVTTRTAFVSAAKDGEPKHPSRRVLNAFRRRGFGVHATQGQAKSHRTNGAPDRGWGPSRPLPFFTSVEALD